MERPPKRFKSQNNKEIIEDNRPDIESYIKMNYTLEQKRNYPHFVFKKINKFFNETQHAHYKIYCQTINPTENDVMSFISCLTDEQIASAGI